MAAPNKGHSSEGSHIALKRLRTSKSASRLFLNLVDTVRPSDPSSAHPSPRNLHAHGVSKPLSRAARSHSELEDSKTMRVLMGAESEFDSLPPALRRKYFSTLERLRLAQSAASPTTPKHGRLSRPPSAPIAKASIGKPRPNIDRGTNHLSGSPTKRLRKRKSAKGDYLVSQADAQWFLSLPEKIQRRHFTREEQSLLTGNRDSVMLDAADEVLYRKRRPVNSSSDSLQDSVTGSRRSSMNPAEEDPPVDSAVDMDDAMHDSFRWLDEEEDLDLKLDDYHTHIAAVAEQTKTPAARRRPSFRRTISLNSLQFGRNSASSNRVAATSQSATASPAAPRSSHRQSNSRPLSTLLAPRHAAHASTSSIDPLAKHYQDPEARLKLRVYLASPQKFDEAIEFGFPAIEDKENILPVRPTTAARRADNSGHTFLADDTASLFNDDSGDNDDDISIEDSDSPKTPQHATFRPSETWKQTSVDKSGPVKPHLVSRSFEPYHQAPAASREMTLHMTLTRPDLRTADETARAMRRCDDRLKLPDLPRSTGSASIWDSLPADGSKVRRIWRKLRRRS